MFFLPCVSVNVFVIWFSTPILSLDNNKISANSLILFSASTKNRLLLCIKGSCSSSAFYKSCSLVVLLSDEAVGYLRHKAMELCHRAWELFTDPDLSWARLCCYVIRSVKLSKGAPADPLKQSKSLSRGS